MFVFYFSIVNILPLLGKLNIKTEFTSRQYFCKTELLWFWNFTLHQLCCFSWWIGDACLHVYSNAYWNHWKSIWGKSISGCGAYTSNHFACMKEECNAHLFRPLLDEAVAHILVHFDRTVSDNIFSNKNLRTYR